MKIGVLTYYGDLNCGTNLQAYATYMAVKKVYPNEQVEVVPIHTFIAISKFRKYLPFLTWFFYHTMEDKYKAFKKDVLKVENDVVIYDVKEALDFISAQYYDKLFIGADTLLELDRLPEGYDGLSAYWLKDVKAKKYLLAASSKNVEYEKLTTKQKADMKEAANQFSGIAVRDRATSRLFSHVVDESRIEYISDPTFTLDIDYSYTENYLKKKGITIPEKAVLIHASMTEKWPKAVVKKLHALGYRVFTPRFNTWSDVCLNDMSPLEQLGIYRHFKFVITHRFHDSVFCMKNNTPVMVYVMEKKVMMTKDGDSKHVSILKDFGLFPNAFLGCCQDDDFMNFDLEERINKVVNAFKPELVNAKIAEKAKEYMGYLERTK